MVANILAAPLIELAPRLTAHTAINGKLCLSGLLEHQIDASPNPTPINLCLTTSD